MMNKCIYCGIDHDLSESDIIPDALTNARILNRNVCRIEHNNKFKLKQIMMEDVNYSDVLEIGAEKIMNWQN